MTDRKRVLCALFCCFLCAALLCGVSSQAFAADTLEELRAEQDDLERRKEENDLKLEELRKDTDQKRAYRDTLYQQIDTLQGQIDLLRRQIDDLNAQITQAEDKLAEKQEGINRNMDLLKERVRALYVTGDASTLEMILNSRNLIDFAEKTQFLKAITQHDQELIKLLNGQMDAIQEDLDKIKADKAELSGRKKDLDSKGAELTELYQEAQKLVDDAENQELNARTNSELLGSQIEENQDAIAALEEEIRKQGISGSGYAGTGSFIWPMPGYTYLTCYFGENGHRGIDIAGGDIYGKPIVAADSGTVTYAGWNDSYGWCVFIDHGNGYETRYAHMSALGTDTGAAVDQGQIIGYVGSTGNSTGPHLHFEVISGGGLTDPMGYF